MSALRQEYADMLRCEFSKDGPHHFLLGTIESAAAEYSEATFGPNALARIREIMAIYRECQK